MSKKPCSIKMPSSPIVNHKRKYSLLYDSNDEEECWPGCHICTQDKKLDDYCLNPKCHKPICKDCLDRIFTLKGCPFCRQPYIDKSLEEFCKEKPINKIFTRASFKKFVQNSNRNLNINPDEASSLVVCGQIESQRNSPKSVVNGLYLQGTFGIENYIGLIAGTPVRKPSNRKKNSK